MQNFRTLGLIIKKVRDLFNLSDKYGKIIQCGLAIQQRHLGPGRAGIVVLNNEKIILC